jgi:hypothetical protein
MLEVKKLVGYVCDLILFFEFLLDPDAKILEETFHALEGLSLL